MYTVFSKPEETRGDWFLVDAAGKTLGRLASEIAPSIDGQTQANYCAASRSWRSHRGHTTQHRTRHRSQQLTDKFYHQHTGYVGNLKSISLDKLLKEQPERRDRVRGEGMLPKGPLGRRMYKKLHVFGARIIPITAQQPKALEFRFSKDRKKWHQRQPSIHFTAPAGAKTSSARVYLRQGTGKCIDIGRTLARVLRQTETGRMIVQQTLRRGASSMENSMSTRMSRGGGITGQAGAIRHGITRAAHGV